MFNIVNFRKGSRVHSNVTVGATPTLIVPANGNRKGVTIANNGAAVVFLGTASVSASGPNSGLQLAAGITLTDNASDREWYGVTAGTSVTVHALEVT
jgi:hypothetical protein